MATPNAAQNTEVTFISGVTNTANGPVVGGPSYSNWNRNNPATYGQNFSGLKWGNTTLGTGATITYFFDPASNWTDVEQAAWNATLALWSAETNVTFSQAPNAAAASFVIYRGTGNSFWSSSVVPVMAGSTTRNNPTASNNPYTTPALVINTSRGAWGPIGAPLSSTLNGNIPWQTMVHEEGHMLGLGHAGPYNGDVIPATQQFGVYDTQLWSTMSYIRPNDNTARLFSSYPVTQTNWGNGPANGAPGFVYPNAPSTPMMLDILAAQQIYGAPTSGPLTTGNTTFGFNCNVTGVINQFFNFTQNTVPIITIYDTGPNNTLDLSGFNGNATINLNPGSFTSAGQDFQGTALTNNIGIAFGTQINNAVGTRSGFDQFIPNPALKGTLTAGGGTNTFTSTQAGLSGDTLTNLQAGNLETVRAVINFTDANPATFSYTWNNSTLNYGGSALTTIGTVANTSAIGRFVQSADPTSGVDLSLVAADPLAHDFNGNHTSDILLQNGGTVVDWMMSNGAYSSGNTLSNAVAGFSVVGTGDWTNSGTDGVLLQSGGAVVDWIMQNGVYSSGNALANAPGWTVVGTGDFNGDGTTDVLLQNGGQVVDWMIQNGLYSSGNGVTADTAGFTVVGTGDFTGNGISDVLLQNGGNVVDWIMQNGVVVGGNSLTATAAGWKVVGTGDLLDNGTSDVVLQSGNGTVVDWIMQNGVVVGGNELATAPGWNVVRVGDYNADGTSDILLQDGGGNVVDWTMRNGQYVSGNQIASAPGWKIG